VTTLDALGSNFCLVGNMETMHIDIVVSEHGKTEKKKGKSKAKRLYVEINASESRCWSGIGRFWSENPVYFLVGVRFASQGH
jgi:hypothetical protein